MMYLLDMGERLGKLLIVPEGIEILYRVNGILYNENLLIVPEGIEIKSLKLPLNRFYTFNRTRRNWN